MALGNNIILTPEPRGRRTEGIINGGLKPGTVVQVVAGGARDAGNRLEFEAYNKSASGEPALIAVLDFDFLSGKSADDAIPDGKRGFVYYPLNGDELNMLVADQSGTGGTSDFSVGDLLKVEDGTGKLIDGTLSGTVNCPFEVQENYSDMVGDTRLHTRFTGV